MTLDKAILEALLREIAEELDKGINADIGWLKYQGDAIREAAELIAK
jgi:hypothetical protein